MLPDNPSRRALVLALLLTLCWAAWPGCSFAERTGYAELYTGFGTTGQVFISGRALEGNPPETSEEKGSVLGNIARTVKLLDSDELTSRPVKVECAGRLGSAVSDEEGFFGVWLKSGEKLFPTGELPVSVTVSLSRRTALEASGKAIVFEDSPPYVVVTDFDDTLVETGGGHRVKALLQTLTTDPARMKPVEGMNEFLKALLKAPDESGPAAPLFYVSGGPVNFYSRVFAFLELNHFPPGVLILRKFGLSEEDDPLSVQAYKKEKIETLLNLFERSQFILIGDTAEKDPEIYSAVKEKHPGRVRAILIRRLEGDDSDAARFRGMLLFRSGADALEAARMDGLIKPEGQEKSKTVGEGKEAEKKVPS